MAASEDAFLPPPLAPHSGFMQIHASCAALEGAGVIVTGPAGSGKSDLVLRLIDRGFVLVADDRVDIVDGIARPPAVLAGLIEVRGLGVLRLPFLTEARVQLAVDLSGGVSGGNPAGIARPDAGERLPAPMRHPLLDVPMIALDPRPASAAQRVALALACAQGRVPQLAGAFAA